MYVMVFLVSIRLTRTRFAAENPYFGGPLTAQGNQIRVNQAASHKGRWIYFKTRPRAP